jgi:hypothetical protein
MKTKQRRTRDRVTPRPAKTAYTTPRQIVQRIPEGLPDRIAREAGAAIGTFFRTSRVPALLCGRTSRSGSPNESRDAARLREPEPNRIRGATAPKRNAFANADRRRDPEIAAKLCRTAFAHLRAVCPSFAQMVFEAPAERRHKAPRILSDQTVRMSRKGSGEKHPEVLRRVAAIVEVDGKDMEMTFITNNFAWSPRTVAELCRARRAIETFFKELKQTLQLADFVGYNGKAVKRQVRTGLLAHLPLRFLKHVSKRGPSFSRLVGTVRSAVRMKIDLLETLRLHGPAGGPKRPVIVEKQLCFQGFERFSNVPVG